MWVAKEILRIQWTKYTSFTKNEIHRITYNEKMRELNISGIRAWRINQSEAL